MSKTIEYIDDYGDRYVTTVVETLVGKEIKTQIYSIRPFIGNLNIKRTKGSVEVYGTISTSLDIYNKNNQLLTRNHKFEEDWIEVWNECVDFSNKDEFKFRLNNIITSECVGECSVGSCFTDAPTDITASTNDVIWGDITEDGSIVFKYDEDSTLFKFIDVWDDDGNIEDRLFNTFFPYQFNFDLN
jgi:hypothetical protein